MRIAVGHAVGVDRLNDDPGLFAEPLPDVHDGDARLGFDDALDLTPRGEGFSVDPVEHRQGEEVRHAPWGQARHGDRPDRQAPELVGDPPAREGLQEGLGEPLHGLDGAGDAYARPLVHRDLFGELQDGVGGHGGRVEPELPMVRQVRVELREVREEHVQGVRQATGTAGLVGAVVREDPSGPKKELVAGGVEVLIEGVGQQHFLDRHADRSGVELGDKVGRCLLVARKELDAEGAGGGHADLAVEGVDAVQPDEEPRLAAAGVRDRRVAPNAAIFGVRRLIPVDEGIGPRALCDRVAGG